MVIFGTVFRSRKSLEKILIQAVKEGNQDLPIFEKLVNIYNTGIFGICIYRARHRFVGTQYFIEKAK